MNARQYRWLSLTFLLAWLSSMDPPPAAANRPTNFIVILADDMGYGDASCYGNTNYATPNLDRMAKQGMRFTDFHSSGAVCSPTRAGLLTGRYQQRSGITRVVFAAKQRPERKWGMQPQERTLAEVMQNAGYVTGICGKWHLGYELKYNPRYHGFDFFRGYVSGNVDFISHIDGVGDHDWWHGLNNTREEGYTTHLITQHAVQFIKSNSNRPFFLYVAHEAPHYPYQGPTDPAIRREGQAGQSKGNPAHHQRAYREMMTEMDAGIGELFDVLIEQKIDEQTCVVFFSDNGGTGPGSNGTLRGKKGTLWEGGHRVPAIARWPGRIPANSESKTLAISIDLMPTICALAKASLPEDLVFDGVDLTSVLTNRAQDSDQVDLPARQVFWAHGNQLAMREGPWKLIRGRGDNQRPTLYNLDSDLQESIDLSRQQSARTQRMLSALANWHRETTTDATPQP